MKLLEAIRNLSADNVENISDICNAIEDRLCWLEDREPESDGQIYDEWDEKHDEWEEILNIAQELEASEDSSKEEIESLIEDLQTQVEDFQIMHGGLSRLKI